MRREAARGVRSSTESWDRVDGAPVAVVAPIAAALHREEKAQTQRGDSVLRGRHCLNE